MLKSINGEVDDEKESEMSQLLKEFRNSTRTDILAMVGAIIFNFAYDDMNQSYHAQVDTWQRIFGYNHFYDLIFYLFTDMKKEEFEFNYNNKKHRLWMWKGDYYGFCSGAEFGLYAENKIIGKYEHYDAVDFELPMTLSLYNYDSSKQIINIFSWMPEDPQWWITGFNTEFKQPVSEKMAFIGTIDLSGNEDLYKEMHENMKSINSLIFGEKNMLWIIFDKGVKI